MEVISDASEATALTLALWGGSSPKAESTCWRSASSSLLPQRSSPTRASPTGLRKEGVSPYAAMYVKAGRMPSARAVLCEGRAHAQCACCVM